MAEDTTHADRPSLTREQQRPLEVRGASVALSAGAGCGKTTVLTERFLGHLDEGGAEALRTIVAVTFTEKAARELRQRIRATCRERLRSSGDRETVDWRGVLRALEAAPVSTFHEFCGGVLRRHALSAGIDPAFQVFDAAIARTILEETVAHRIRAWLAQKDEDLITLAVEFSLEQVRDALAQLVSGRDADQLTSWAERDESEICAIWKRLWEERVRCNERRRFLDEAELCRSWWLTQSFDHAKLAAKRLELLAELNDAAHRAEDLDWLDSLKELAKVPRGLRKPNWGPPEVHLSGTQSLEDLRKVITAWKETVMPDESGSMAGAQLGRRFARLAADVRKAYAEAKRRRGGLDFDDLLLKTRDLLRDDPAVCRTEGDGVAFVLVDEFQDTDPIQSEILERLSGDGYASGRLFVVGDFKQSIYRFRGARPRLFQRYREDFPEAGRLGLSENFRSVSGVLDFVNALFVGAFPVESGRLIPGPGSQSPSDRPAVEFVWPKDEEVSAEEDVEGDAEESRRKTRTSAAQLRRTEARWLARIVRHRLAEGWLIRDRKKGEVRRAHAGDVAFLFRAMTDLAPYGQALADEGLDFHVIGGAAFYAQQEIQDLINILSVIEDPFDGIALAGALRGPFFGLTDDGLYSLGGSGHGDLAERFLDGDASGRLPATDRQRAERAREWLQRWRDFKDRVPIGDLVDRVLTETGYEAALLGEYLGDRKRANARKLVRMARDFDARGGFTLAHFVARLRADLRDPPREEQAATTDEEGESIRILSVHQSKGLEFPIVVVPDLNRSQQGRHGFVMFDLDLGPVVRSSGMSESEEGPESKPAAQSLGWKAFTATEKLEEEEESIRLFYVATTRARDALILSAGGGPEATPASPALKHLSTRFDRGNGRCLVGLPEDWGSPHVGIITESPPALPGGHQRERRASLRTVAQQITSTAEARPAVSEPRHVRPTLLNLDAVRGLSSRATRLDRLVRAILSSPKALQPDELADSSRLEARRQVPRMTEAEAQDVARRLERPLTGLLDHATEVRPGASWSVAWPPNHRDATVVLGWWDLLVRDGQGRWGVVVFSPPGIPDVVERLRWALSVEAAKAMGVSPIGSGWRIVLDEPARFRGEEPLGLATIGELLSQVVGDLGPTEEF